VRLPNLTGEFRVGSDPELRFTPSGKAVCSVSLMATESRKTDTGWEDGDSTPWISASVWDQQAEAVAERVRKGMKVLVNGLLFARTYTRSDGTEGTSIELKWATVAPIPGGEPKGQRVQPGAAYDDPWQTPRPGQSARQNVPADPWSAPAVQSDDPPF